jgi:hypothetical protein
LDHRAAPTRTVAPLPAHVRALDSSKPGGGGSKSKAKSKSKSKSKRVGGSSASE